MPCSPVRCWQRRLFMLKPPGTSSTTLPRSVRHWSLTTLREKLIKIGAKVVGHARYVTFQLAEVAVPRDLFATILDWHHGAGKWA